MAKKPVKRASTAKSASAKAARGRSRTKRAPAAKRPARAPKVVRATAGKKPTVRPARRSVRPAKLDNHPLAAPDLRLPEPVELPPTTLTPAEVDEFRQALMDKRAELLGDVGTLQDEALRGSRREVSGDLSSMPVHMADLGTDNYELEFTLGLIEGGRALLHEIDEALERIRRGTYGNCLATGKPIGKARLRAKPWAKFSYEYTLALEKGRRHGS